MIETSNKANIYKRFNNFVFNNSNNFYYNIHGAIYKNDCNKKIVSDKIKTFII